MKLDLQQIADAMAGAYHSRECYLNVETGALLMRADEDMRRLYGRHPQPADLRTDDLDARIAAHDPALKRVPVMYGADVAGIRRYFAHRVSDPRDRRKLAAALEGSAPDHHFDELVYASSRLSLAWQRARSAWLRRNVASWLDDIGVTAEDLTHEPATRSASDDPFDLVTLLLFGAPDGKTEILDGCTRRVVMISSERQGRDWFVMVARQLCAHYGEPWRNPASPDGRVFEIGRFRLERFDEYLELVVHISMGAYAAVNEGEEFHRKDVVEAAREPSTVASGDLAVGRYPASLAGLGVARPETTETVCLTEDSASALQNFRDDYVRTELRCPNCGGQLASVLLLPGTHALVPPCDACKASERATPAALHEFTDPETDMRTYLLYDLRFEQTCSEFPEAYDIFRGEQEIAHASVRDILRVRHSDGRTLLLRDDLQSGFGGMDDEVREDTIRDIAHAIIDDAWQRRR